ncbi:MAG: class I SAM-dependent methyltransferase [Bacteroidetes bacterium]|nr:class I SAM-dependent methyltransferase [Bacteroidota bacterium]
MNCEYERAPDKVIQVEGQKIHCFDIDGENIDNKVVQGFGEEWLKFKNFSDAEIDSIASDYFDIINEKIVNNNTYAIDIGCGTGRWTKYLSKKAGFIEAVDPSSAIFSAAHLLNNTTNVRLTQASVETLPFKDNTFDFAMSIGVLHHIPDTQKAMKDCVKKVKPGGYFYTYLYYNFEERGLIFRTLFSLSNGLRKAVSQLPSNAKKVVCDVFAVTLYMPFIILARLLKKSGLKNLARRIPLYEYADKSFFIIRNDSLDRFGTSLEQRFSKSEIIEMMRNSGLEEIVISEGAPYYHAIGKKI